MHNNAEDNELSIYRNAVHPSLSMDRVSSLMSKFGIIHRRANEIKEKGVSIHWKTNVKRVNVGTCYYKNETDTFYIRSSCNGGVEFDDTRNVAYMEIERSTVDLRYNTVKLFVKSPADDLHKKKITACSNHMKNTGQSTFFTARIANNSSNEVIIKNETDDMHVFDINGNKEKFIGFKIRFWCWTHCKKGDFSNKNTSIRFMAKLCGENVEDMQTFSNINVQRNPGRGAGVVQKKINYPDPTGEFRPCGSKPTSRHAYHSHPNNGLLNSDVNFIDNGRLLSTRQVRVNIDLPKVFFDILGPGQARVEVEGLKRDIDAMAKNRIQDAINRKIAGNEDLLRDNEILRTAVSNLQHIIVNNNKQSELLQLENNRLSAQLESNAANNVKQNE